MNKVLLRVLSLFMISGVITCASIIIIFGAVREVFTTDNLQKSFACMDIEEMFNGNTESYNDFVKDHINHTGFTKNEIDKILTSAEYSNIVGNYMIEEDMLNMTDISSLSGLESIDEAGLVDDSSLTQVDLKSLLEELDISYTSNDLSYMEDSIATNVAPNVQLHMEENLNNNSIFGQVKFDFLKSKYSEEVVKVCWIALVICCIVLAIIYFDYFQFFVSYAICSGAMCLMSRVLYSIIKNFADRIPNSFKPMVKIFSDPLENVFLKDFRILLIITLVCILLFFLVNLTVSKTSISSSNPYLYRLYRTETDIYHINSKYEMKLNSWDDEYDEEDDVKEEKPDVIEEDFYNTSELKDITFSNDVYVHDDI